MEEHSVVGLLGRNLHGKVADLLAKVLVPNDQAISTFTSANPNITDDQEAVLALLQYHCTNGTHPSATFALQPQFVPTLLTNSNFTNVTGGQVVEITTQNSKPVILSGVKAVSHIAEAVSGIPVNTPLKVWADWHRIFSTLGVSSRSLIRC